VGGLVGLLVVGSVAALHPVWLQAAGDLLVLREPPRAADGVVVLGGDTYGGRALRGTELVRAGYAPRVYVLDERACAHGSCTRWSELWRSGKLGEAESTWAGLPEGAVVPLLDDIPAVPGTYEEAIEAWERLRPLGVRRILLVTDPFHSRRAALTWRKVVGGEADVSSVPCDQGCLAMDGWWRDREGLKAVWLEYARLAGYLVAGYL
jgi:uncharacterized SAM-binding protein YcdF (DUF218 family)